MLLTRLLFDPLPSNWPLLFTLGGTRHSNPTLNCKLLKEEIFEIKWIKYYFKLSWTSKTVVKKCSIWNFSVPSASRPIIRPVSQLYRIVISSNNLEQKCASNFSTISRISYAQSEALLGPAQLSKLLYLNCLSFIHIIKASQLKDCKIGIYLTLRENLSSFVHFRWSSPKSLTIANYR